MQSEPVSSWGAAFMASLTNALVVFTTAIPRIIGFLLILLIGWLIAKGLGKGTSALLRAVKFDDAARRARFDQVTRKLGSKTGPAGLVGNVVKWLVLIVTLLVAFDALGLPQIANLFQALLLWIPNLAVAIAVLFLAGLAAEPLGNIVRGATAEAGFSSPDTLARVARIGVWIFAAIVALAQLGIAENLIYALFYGFVAAVALAFGLGARETAGRVVEGWYSAVERRTGGPSAARDGVPEHGVQDRLGRAAGGNF